MIGARTVCSPATDVSPLLATWVPALEATERRLRRGARVAEIGGAGTSGVVRLALAYPTSTFHGFDDDLAAVDEVRRAAARAGVSDRVTYEGPIPRADAGRYDLVRVREAASSWRPMLRRGGVLIAPARSGATIRTRSALVPGW